MLVILSRANHPLLVLTPNHFTWTEDFLKVTLNQQLYLLNFKVQYQDHQLNLIWIPLIMVIHLNYHYFCYQINLSLNHYYLCRLNQSNHFTKHLSFHFTEIINQLYCHLITHCLIKISHYLFYIRILDFLSFQLTIINFHYMPTLS